MKRLKPHLTPATGIAFLALILAVTGVSFAATGAGNGGSKGGADAHFFIASAAKSKGAKGPRGPRGPAGRVGPAGPAGKSGATGPQGPAGANGSSGQGVTSTAFSGAKGSCTEGGAELTSASGTTLVCNGEEGAKGTNGKSVISEEFTGAKGTCKEGGSELSAGANKTYVCNGHEGTNGKEGSPWTAGGTLPAGSSETGTWSVQAASETVTRAFMTASISFPIPLAAPLGEEAEHAKFITTEEQNKTQQEKEAEVTKKCSLNKEGKVFGSVGNPIAAPGNLCIYQGATFGGETTPGSFSEPVACAPEEAQEGECINGPAAGTTGAALRVFFQNGSGKGITAPFEQGTWAVTPE
jgi:hypothetical protein